MLQRITEKSDRLTNPWLTLCKLELKRIGLQQIGEVEYSVVIASFI